VETIRYFDVGASRVLCQYPLGSRLDQVGLRTFDVSKEAYFGKIHNIFIMGKDFDWLSYDPSTMSISLFNKEVDSVYFLADLKEGVNVSAQKFSKDGTDDTLLQAAYVTAYLLLEKNEQEIASALLQSIGDSHMARKATTALSTYEKHKLLESFKRCVATDFKGCSTQDLPEASLLDLLANLMEGPNNFFYPFSGQLVKQNFEGFMPDSLFPIAFNQLVWSTDELTLSATVKVPGIFYLENPSCEVPSCIETFSTMTIDVIKYGVPCKKLAVSLDGKKGYLPLADYHMVSDFKTPPTLEMLCDILHKRNCLLLKDKVFSYLVQKSQSYVREDLTTAYCKRFETFNADQKKYLASKSLFGDGARWTVHQTNKPPCFNFYEEEFETIFKNIDIILSTCTIGKSYEDFKGQMDMFTFGIIHELIQETFNTIFEESDNYFTTLKTLKESNWDEFLTYETAVQKLRFLITYAPEKFTHLSKNEICAIRQNSFNFIFEQSVGGALESYAY
jgi:hypothetical protein